MIICILKLISGPPFKNLLSLIYLEMAFNPNDYVSPYVTLEEVLEIKKAFDLFDRDLGGAIDPRGTSSSIQNSKSPSIPSELKLRLRQSIR